MSGIPSFVIALGCSWRPRCGNVRSIQTRMAQPLIVCTRQLRPSGPGSRDSNGWLVHPK